ncbi:hypothetical protein P7C70_g5286, partial [Phenoliferia sp. Uapishka_3]
MAPRIPKFVKLPSWDDGKSLPDVFFEDANKWVPDGKRDKFGRLEYWGTSSDYDSDGGDMMSMMNAMMLKSQYSMKNMNKGKDRFPTPQHQFIGKLVERKRAQLESVDVSAMEKCDIVLEISLSFDPKKIHASFKEVRAAKLKPITRRIRVPAGMKLSVFQDKVVQPVMGWDRNFHAYIFTVRDTNLFCDRKRALTSLTQDYRDGSQFGTERGDTDLLGLTRPRYDLKENMQGNARYGTRLATYLTGTAAEQCFSSTLSRSSLTDKHLQIPRSKFKKDVLDCPNYAYYKSSASSFDPFFFDEMAAHRRLGSALSSKQSNPQGAKIHTVHLASGCPDCMEEEAKKSGKGKGKKVEVKRTTPGSYWTETKNTGRDKEGQRACCVCGKSRETELSKCSVCKLVD